MMSEGCWRRKIRASVLGIGHGGEVAVIVQRLHARRRIGRQLDRVHLADEPFLKGRAEREVLRHLVKRDAAHLHLADIHAVDEDRHALIDAVEADRNTVPFGVRQASAFREEPERVARGGHDARTNLTIVQQADEQRAVIADDQASARLRIVALYVKRQGELVLVVHVLVALQHDEQLIMRDLDAVVGDVRCIVEQA